MRHYHKIMLSKVLKLYFIWSLLKCLQLCKWSHPPPCDPAPISDSDHILLPATPRPSALAIPSSSLRPPPISDSNHILLSATPAHRARTKLQPSPFNPALWMPGFHYSLLPSTPRPARKDSITASSLQPRARHARTQLQPPPSNPAPSTPGLHYSLFNFSLLTLTWPRIPL